MNHLLYILTASALYACSSNPEPTPLPNADSIQAMPASTEVETPPPAANLAKSTISLTAADGLEVTADVYTKGDQPWMLLCHQAGFSRGEYIETAPLLVEMGYNCIALDQRSGKAANGITNETAARAKSQGLPGNYIDALPDLEAGLAYAFEQSGGKPVIIVGSSYSSSLVLKVGNGDDRVQAVMSFSPGEYYRGESVAGWASGMDKPVFATSSKSEGPGVKEVTAQVPASNLVHFVPSQEGVHGSRALWEAQDNHDEYWTAVKSFLESLE